MVDEERPEVASIGELDRVIYSVGVYGMKLLIREADIRVYIKNYIVQHSRETQFEKIYLHCKRSAQARSSAGLGLPTYFAFASGGLTLKLCISVTTAF